MKVLWFTNTPSNAAVEFGSTYAGGGWIAALETLLVKDKSRRLGICFFYTGKDYKTIKINDVTYYGIPLKTQNGLQRILGRQMGWLTDGELSPLFDEVIKDFQPDIIHVFGTEMGYGKILKNKFDKVVFHLQGLVSTIAEVYFPMEISKKDTLKFSSTKSIIKGISSFHVYLEMKARGKRELEIVTQWQYFSGRTQWDQNFIQLLNPSAKYFHCDELLREDFFNHHWTEPKQSSLNECVVIATTLNPIIYKGLDLIYKVLPLLKNHTICWKIIGCTEDNDLNRMVKKTVNNNKANPAIKFCGQLSAGEIIAELKTCHFFVHPSYIDNSPNSVCEAQLLGMPVISSSVGGVPTLITNGENGFLFNPYDKYDLAGQLKYLITNYSVALEAAKKGKQTALKRHSPEAILNSVNNMYNTIYDNQESIVNL